MTEWIIFLQGALRSSFHRDANGKGVLENLSLNVESVELFSALQAKMVVMTIFNCSIRSEKDNLSF